MKKPTATRAPRNFDKFLFEAGQQCQKRLWLDYHEPAEAAPSSVRQARSEAGEQLRALARSAFPKGVAIAATSADEAAAETKQRIAEGVPVLFGATFVADGVEARCDILVVHKGGACDLFEIKSGTKVKQRYVNDLALQAHVLIASGHTLRAAWLLHVNPKYVHKEGADYPPMQLLRSNEVTEKVQKQLEHVPRRLQQFRRSLADEAVLQLPTGTFCTHPFPCPHLPRCAKQEPEHPLRELPELSRQQELALHKEGIEDLMALDDKHAGLTFRQRRTLACLRQGGLLVEPFVREELRQCARPLHFLAIAAITDTLPRFDDQRPWRSIPYGFAAQTVHADGRLETASFVHVERTDPRPGFATGLAKHLEVGGTVVVWDDEALAELRSLLEDLPAAKTAARTIVGHPHLDMMQLFEAGVFHPKLRSLDDLRTSVAVLLDDDSGADLAAFGEDALLSALQRAWAPRVRAATRDKIAAEVLAALTWASSSLTRLYERFAGVEVAAAKARPATRPKASKPLPRPLE